MKWHQWRQHGFLTVAIVVGVACVLDMISPVLDRRGALFIIAVLALLLGWKP